MLPDMPIHMLLLVWVLTLLVSCVKKRQYQRFKYWRAAVMWCSHRQFKLLRSVVFPSKNQFDVCVTTHHWYNNINSQLDATITNVIDDYNQLNMFWVKLSPETCWADCNYQWNLLLLHLVGCLYYCSKNQFNIVGLTNKSPRHCIIFTAKHKEMRE